MSEDNIQSTLHEDRHFPPSDDFVKNSALTPSKLNKLQLESKEDNQEFWAQQARSEIDWQTPFNTTLDSSNAPFYRW